MMIENTNICKNKLIWSRKDEEPEFSKDVKAEIKIDGEDTIIYTKKAIENILMRYLFLFLK